jgi:hypothetical protein
MTGRQEYDRTKDRQRILGKYMIDILQKAENRYTSLKQPLIRVLKGTVSQDHFLCYNFLATDEQVWAPQLKALY